MEHCAPTSIKTKMERYTPEEDAILKKYYKKLISTEIRKRFLPHRTNKSLLRRAQTLKITGKRGRPWTEEEIKRMKEMIDDCCILSEIAETLNRTKQAVKEKYRNFGWKIKAKPYKNKYASGISKIWTEKDIKQLIDLAGRNKMRVVAEKLNKNIHAVEIKSSRLGISFRQGIITKKEACNILGIADRTLNRHLKKLKLMNSDKHITDPEVLSTVAENILNDNRSLNRCGASIKQLEAVARGDFEYAGVAQSIERSSCKAFVRGSSPLTSSNMIAWEEGV